MKTLKLSEIWRTFPTGSFIASEATKRYCFGQPQLRYGEYIFVDSFIEGIKNFRGIIEFPTLFIDCEN